jgi:cell division inhibitor SepF
MAGIWRKTLIYLGLVEDDELDEYGYDDLMEPEEQLTRRSRRQEPDVVGRHSAGVVRQLQPSGQARFHLVHPRSFNDAQEVGDKFREGFSVIMNLSTADTELSRRLIDFASGLAYGLGGAMQPVADRVFLVTPSGVQVSAEERRRLLEERGFFNQA